MKRLLVLMSAVVTAVAAQASTVSWQSGYIYLPDASGNWSSTKAGSAAAKLVSAYYFVSDVAITDTDFSSYFDYNTTTGAISLKSGKTASSTAQTAFAGTANGSSTINEGEKLYALAFYTFTDANKNGWYISGTVTAELGVGDLEITYSDTKIAETYGKTAGWTSAASPVPEPTTVALLALGLAAVGLKRKVA